jgi:peptide/nickel transport system substrate-binding protein
MRWARLRLAAWILVFAVSSPVLVDAEPNTLRIGLPSVPSELDPATALDGPVPFIARQVFDTLVQYVEGGSDIEPGLAVQWSVSRDGLVWSFRLRGGVSFHDGTTLTAQHVAQSLAREIFPGHPLAGSMPTVAPRLLRGAPGVVKQVRAVDERTVEIRLLQPYAPLLTVLAHPVFSIVLPIATGADGGKVDAATKWQGTGPFSVAELGAGRIALDARPPHWRGAPRVSRLVFAESGDDAQARAQLDAQSLDAVFSAGAPPRQAGSLSIPGWRIGYLALQTEKEPFNRIKARRAAAAALDPRLIGAALGQVASPLQAFLPSGVWGRRDAAPLMGADPERAKRLFSEAGLTRGVPVALTAPGEGGKKPDLIKVAEAVRTSLGAVGFAVSVHAAAPEAALARAQSGDDQMALEEAYAVGGDPHFLLYPLSATEGATKGTGAVNLSFYRDKRLDDLLIRASQLSFRVERERLYLRAQGMLAESLPWIPLYVRLHWATVRQEVKNLRLHPSGNPRLERVWLDTPATSPAPLPAGEAPPPR